jgi:hypothetical protein
MTPEEIIFRAFHEELEKLAGLPRAVVSGAGGAYGKYLRHSAAQGRKFSKGIAAGTTTRGHAANMGGLAKAPAKLELNINKRLLPHEAKAARMRGLGSPKTPQVAKPQTQVALASGVRAKRARPVSPPKSRLRSLLGF